MSPPDNIADRDNSDSLKIFFIFCMSITSALSLFLIVLAAQYTIAANRSVRDSDKIRVLIHVDPWLPIDPTTMGVICMYGSSLFLLAGITAGQFAEYGQ